MRDILQLIVACTLCFLISTEIKNRLLFLLGRRDSSPSAFSYTHMVVFCFYAVGYLNTGTAGYLKVPAVLAVVDLNISLVLKLIKS